jgi:hypothetical protein
MSALFFDSDQQAAIRSVLPMAMREEESAVRWALNACGELALGHTEYVRCQRNGARFKGMRDALSRIRKKVQRELARLAPSRKAQRGAVSLLLRMSRDVARDTADYAFMVEKNTHPKNSHRELIYRHLLYIWTSLGGTLSVTYDSYRKTATGPLISYFQCVASLVFGEAQMRGNTIADIVRREKELRQGKPTRDRKNK